MPDPDYKALCAELEDAYTWCIEEYMTAPAEEDTLIQRARAELAKPAPAPTETTTEELLRLAREWNSGHESIEFEFIDDYARAVLARWGNA
jgi:hypothetical protein